MSGVERICLFGFGEVGQILAADLLSAGRPDLVTWDVQFADRESAPRRAAASMAVDAGSHGIDAAAGVDLIISAVTAAETVAAATVAAPGLQHGTWFLDLNSASPGAKAQAAQIVEAAGGRYVEASVMSPISPKRIATTILLGGPNAQAFLPVAHELGLTGAQHFSATFGQASAAKMCRSVLVKGIESLLTESLLAARHYGVDSAVIASLTDLFPGPDWPRLSEYMVSRSLEHGGRRAEEMREVAKTVRQAGVSPLMSEACAERQDWSASRKAVIGQAGLAAMLDAMLGTIERGKDPHVGH